MYPGAPSPLCASHRVETITVPSNGGEVVFEKELAFFIANQSELVQKYEGKVLVISGDDVVGAYDSALHAYLEAQKQFEPGTFMLQPCEPGV